MIPVIPLEQAQHRPRRLAVGEFDGVHLGHREVIRGADTVLTFDPHPRAVVDPGGAPKLLTSLDQKAELVEELGARELVVIPFDRTFAAQEAQDFVDHILVEKLGATHVTVGENFRFGHRAKGTSELLKEQDAFETRVAQLVEVEDTIVSSTHIRGLLMGGQVDVAARFLGAPWELRGEVVEGDKRGRTLGFPTTNQLPDPAFVLPDHGVYATLAGVPGENGTVSWVPAATSIGVRPTFVTGRGTLVETYLIGWDGDLYGMRLRVRFLERLRGEKRFDSAGALVEQMHRDAEVAAGVAATLLRRP